jgi:hypothetical protein
MGRSVAKAHIQRTQRAKIRKVPVGQVTIANQPLEAWRFVGALVAVVCTGMLWGRAAVVAVRMRYAPHVDL